MQLHEQHRLETYKSLITISLEGFKYLALINGGAIISLLTYLGNIAGKELPRPDVRGAALSFMSGLALCGLSLFISYLTQFRLFNEQGPATPTLRSHRLFLYMAIGLSFGSLGHSVLALGGLFMHSRNSRRNQAMQRTARRPYA